MAEYADITVRTSVQNMQTMVQNAFMTQGFKVNWEDALKGKAEKGSKAANFLGGAFAQYYAVNFQVHPGTETHTLRLIKANTGMAGGLIGMSKVNKQFNTLVETLSTWFGQQGALQQTIKK